MAALSQMALHLVALVLLLWTPQIFPQFQNNNPDDENEITLDPKDNLYENCIRDNGREGRCVYDYECYANYSLAIGGDILMSETRASGAPLSNCGPRLWCCTNDTAQTWVPTATSVPVTTMSTKSRTEAADCQRVFDDDCPWCVGLYRPGGDVSRGHRLESGLFCAGTLVGSRVVLTSATCLRTVANEAIWASVPASASPKRHYTISNKIIHENYNSGSHANDFGLMVLNEDVQWNVPGGQSSGACLGLQTPLEGDCLAAGFNMLEEVVTTPVSVRSGKCRARQKAKQSNSDFACGTATAADCHIVPGAPVLCTTTIDGQGGLVIAGVVRQHCIAGSVKIGKLQMHAEWLELQLRRLGVQPLQYSG